MLDARMTIIATHESGHVFVATALGLRVRSVQIGAEPRFDLVDVLGPERRLDHARILMAGCEAEAAILGCEPIGGGSDDLEIARLLCDADDEQELRRQVRLFVAANYPVINRIATALLRERSLTGAQLTALLKSKGDLHACTRPQQH